ncbi:unnamed protein product, partial [Ectocarpus fasciculatus]
GPLCYSSRRSLGTQTRSRTPSSPSGPACATSCPCSAAGSPIVTWAGTTLFCVFR